MAVPTTEQDQLVDTAIAASNSKPELVGHLERLGAKREAESLTGKALIAARSPIGTLLIAVVGYLLSKYGLQLDDQEVTLVSGLFVLLGGYIMRTITRAPITGILKPRPL